MYFFAPSTLYNDPKKGIFILPLREWPASNKSILCLLKISSELSGSWNKAIEKIFEFADSLE